IGPSAGAKLHDVGDGAGDVVGAAGLVGQLGELRDRLFGLLGRGQHRSPPDLARAAVSPVMGDAVDRLPGQAEPARGITAPKPGAGRPLWCEGEEMPLAAASSYPLLNLFWTMAEVFLWVMWICVLVMVFMDIFRSHDLSGWAKALWFLFVLVIPLIGVLVYLIARGGSFNERATQRAQRQDEAYRSSYIQQATPNGPATTADQLAKLADLRDRSVISAEEFEREKAKVLAA